MKSYKYKVMAFGAALMAVASCSESFLDKVPDERTEINTEDKVVSLLVSAYPEGNPAWVCEISSDNLLDNQTPHYPSNPAKKQVLSYYNYSSYSKWDDELYKFEAAENATYSNQDSPGSLWSGYYGSVATVNQALAAIDRISPDGNLSSKLKAAKGEALLLRAYDHFQLVNIFSQAYKSSTESKKDIGIPYVTEIEDVVSKKYDRINVDSVYQLIGKDLEEGLALISDVNYTTAPKYHFNTNAAHAFAARYYLFKRDYAKVIEHANQVIGSDSTSFQRMTMDYSQFSGSSSLSDYANVWVAPSQNNNLMLIDTYSLLQRRLFGYRYSYAGTSCSDALMYRSNHSTLWTGYYAPGISLVSGQLFGSSSHDYGYFSSKVGEHFEYTDKVAGIGYCHQIYRAFTAHMLLLERAEAEVMLGKYADAANDLRWYWNCQLNTFSDDDKKQFVSTGYNKYMTNSEFKNYYAKGTNTNCFSDWSCTQNMSSDFVVPAEAVPYMNCVNDFRRFETSFEGHRFFDLKRWGISYVHHVGVSSARYYSNPTSTSRAIEVPWETISAGLDSSRPTSTNDSEAKKASMNVSDFVIKSK